MTADLTFLGTIAQAVGATEPALRLLISIIVGKCIQCQMKKIQQKQQFGVQKQSVWFDIIFFTFAPVPGACS